MNHSVEIKWGTHGISSTTLTGLYLEDVKELLDAYLDNSHTTEFGRTRKGQGWQTAMKFEEGWQKDVHSFLISSDPYAQF